VAMHILSCIRKCSTAGCSGVVVLLHVLLADSIVECVMAICVLSCSKRSTVGNGGSTPCATCATILYIHADSAFECVMPHMLSSLAGNVRLLGVVVLLHVLPTCALRSVARGVRPAKAYGTG
jgi:hypothetical protein